MAEVKKCKAVFYEKTFSSNGVCITSDTLWAPLILKIKTNTTVMLIDAILPNILL